MGNGSQDDSAATGGNSQKRGRVSTVQDWVLPLLCMMLSEPEQDEGCAQPCSTAILHWSITK